MKKLLQKCYLPLGFILMLMTLAQTAPAFGQSIGSNLYVQNKSVAHHKNAHKMVPLVKVLKKVERSHHITFLYQTGLLEGKKVSRKTFKLDDLGSKLRKILTSKGLTYLKQSEGTYVIRSLPKLNIRPIAQQETVSGTVTNAQTGEPMIGVNILVVGTSTGTVTDADGHYSLTVPSLQDTLRFSFIGFQTKTVPIGGRTTINIAMEPKIISGQQVVVTGYSTQEQKNVIGSIATVDVSELKKTSAVSVGEAFQGHVGGVVVTESGYPGGAVNIHIRGINNFGNSQPLVLVDGVEVNINDVSPANIKSISVLKDAGAAAIYGVRGANGVILISTKSGQRGKTMVTYNSVVGFNFPLHGNPYNLMTPRERAKVVLSVNPNNPLYKNGLPDYFYASPNGAGFTNAGDPAVDPSKYNLDIHNPEKAYLIARANKNGTDWWQTVYSRAPVIRQNVQVSGGSDHNLYLFSLQYLNQQGTLLNSYLKRYSMRLNTQFKLANNRLRIGEHFKLMYKDNPFSSHTPLFALYLFPRILPKHDIKGNFSGTREAPIFRNLANPYALRVHAGRNKLFGWNPMGNIYAEFNIFKNLEIKTTFNGNFKNSRRSNFNFIKYANHGKYQRKNSFAVSSSYVYRWKWNFTLTYSKDIGKNNHLKVLVGNEVSANGSAGLSGFRKGFYSSKYNYVTLSTGSLNQTNSGNTARSTLSSVFGRIDYSYQNTYLVEGTIRRDGSSKFGEKKRYGIFPSFSVGWIISNENFMQELAWLNLLKLKGSYGILGSQNNVGLYNQYNLWGGSFAGTYYPINGGAALKRGFTITQIGNPFTSWERDKVTNLGIKFGIFRKFIFNFSIYNKEINGLLFPKRLPATVGGASPPVINIGNVQNKGIDISVKYNDQVGKELSLSIRANYSMYKNSIANIPGRGYFDVGAGRFGTVSRNQEGHPISSFYGYKVIGLFQSKQDVQSSPKQLGAVPGRFKYKDVNKDGMINPEDRTFIGNPNPDFTAGLSISINYKNFDISTNLFTNYGADAVNIVRYYTDFLGVQVGGVNSKRLLNAWSPNNNNSSIPKVELGGGFSTFGAMNSYFVEDASYLRMKYLEVGYTIPVNKTIISNFRVFVRAKNLITITDYSGIDPEIGGSSALFGVDNGIYPTNGKSVRFGVNITL